MRQKYESEYTLNCSPKVLFSRISTPEGLAEWFASDVTVEGDIFTFTWNKTESRARLTAMKDNRFARFEWLNDDDEESNYFEFKIIIEEMSGSLALIVADFAEPDEMEDAISLWNAQIEDLRRVLGI
jgi:hypothetical protein